ncbi:ATP-binding cassette domain-containing protein [Lichenicola sp.]|uniref:ATP-binding cassette domain-containing protein n=1 Tax=Lichenicola sp. TaxID=2804529 RepID=UPI003B009894
MSAILLEAAGLTRSYGSGQPTVLSGIDLVVAPGETLGIIGGSGSGKSTLARILMGLEPPDSGTVTFRGTDLFGTDRNAIRAVRTQIQAVFQDPYGSLDPRLRIGSTVAEPLLALGLDRAARRERVREALEAVSLPADAVRHYPHEFSGGQRQRIAIARALVTRPALLIADEPVSALDVSVQAQVLNLLLELRRRLDLAYVFISHDLGVIRHVAQRVLVLDAGRIVEQGDAEQVMRAPRHEVTRRLIAALPGTRATSGP